MQLTHSAHSCRGGGLLALGLWLLFSVSGPAQPVTNLKVMSFNVLVSGARGLPNIAEAIRRAGADVVGLQEIAGSPAAITFLATNLGFHSLPGVSVISRYPILGLTVPGAGEVQNGVSLELSPGQRVHVFNCHLAPFPYGPYYLRDGRSSNDTFQLEATTRLPQITNLLGLMKPFLATADPCFLTGDFNVPSHVDYANFPWPVSTAVHAAGLLDSYRLLHPGNRLFPPAFAFDEPGITWTPDGRTADDTFDRIDFVYFSDGDGVTALSSTEQDSRNNLRPWPSDHRAVLSEFRLTPPQARAEATQPWPLHGATQVTTNARLSWLPGSNATAHQVYFGAGASDRLAGTPSTPTFEPGTLAEGTTYFWRVDEVIPSGTVTGAVWSFSTPRATGVSVYEWTFNQTNLAAALGRGTMAYADATTAARSEFARTDDANVPHIGGRPADYLRVPALTEMSNGLLLEFADSGPNGGGIYINRYTLILDVFLPPPLNWTALFNTNPRNANDADWYINPAGRLGIDELGYGAEGVVTASAWHRLAWAADLGAGVVTMYRNGAVAHRRTGESVLNGRFSLYSNVDPGADLLLFNEGVATSSFTHALCVNSVAFTDRAMTATEIAALGGPRAEGIFVRGLRARREAGEIALAWDGAPNVGLQAAASLTAAVWTDILGTQGASTFRRAVPSGTMFFRLAQP